MTSHPTCESRVVSVTVERPVDTVRAYLADPLNFAEWASGLAGGLSSIADQPDGAGDRSLWTARTATGDVTVKFTPPNDYGVADHWVFLPDGSTVYVPLRAVANGNGTEVSLTLFRLPSMAPGKFEEDAAWVIGDLGRLKTALESDPGGT